MAESEVATAESLVERCGFDLRWRTLDAYNWPSHWNCGIRSLAIILLRADRMLCEVAKILRLPHQGAGFRDLQIQADPFPVDQYETGIDKLLPGTVKLSIEPQHV